jgi:hypothetical protein
MHEVPGNAAAEARMSVVLIALAVGGLGGLVYRGGWRRF